MAVPGLTPRSPLTVEDPVLVTAEPPRTAKLAAVPSGTVAGPALASRPLTATTSATSRAAPPILLARSAQECFGATAYDVMEYSIRETLSGLAHGTTYSTKRKQGKPGPSDVLRVTGSN